MTRGFTRLKYPDHMQRQVLSIPRQRGFPRLAPGIEEVGIALQARRRFVVGEVGGMDDLVQLALLDPAQQTVDGFQRIAAALMGRSDENAQVWTEAVHPARLAAGRLRQADHAD